MKSFCSIFALFVLVTSFGCNNNQSVSSNQPMPDCLTNFADLDYYQGLQGTVVMVVNELMIEYSTSGRMHPCNLPSNYNVGDQVIFSGFEKEAPEGVRLAGTPFRLTEIQEL